jgi:mannose/fructose/N-acetylgalactosamine-specific phosphotransferase system component IIC
MIAPWALALVGGVVAVDGTSAGQTMVSRPLVAGALAGAILGDLELGLGLGALLELFAIVAVPAGGVRLTEMGVATVVAVGVGVQLPNQGSVPLAIAYGLVAAEVGGFTVDRLRHLNTRRWEALEGDGLTPGGLVRLHWSAIGADWLRGAGLVLLLVPLGAWGLSTLAEEWPLTGSVTRALLLLAIAVHAGVLLKNWGGWRKRRRFFLGGIVAGLALGIWL